MLKRNREITASFARTGTIDIILLIDLFGLTGGLDFRMEEAQRLTPI